MNVNRLGRTWMGRAAVAALTLVFVLAATALPECGGICCPRTPDLPTVHAQMPCCATQPSFAPRDVARLQPGVTPAHVPLAAIVNAGTSPVLVSRVQTARISNSTSAGESHPQLFLLNAQFLI